MGAPPGAPRVRISNRWSTRRAGFTDGAANPTADHPRVKPRVSAAPWAAEKKRCMKRWVSTLKGILLSPEDRRHQVISDAVRLVETEVRAKGGVSGMAIKAGFAAVNKIKPTLVRDAVDNLLDRFVDKLEPFYAEWSGSGGHSSFEVHLNQQKNRVANALLEVTDERAQQIQTGLVKKTYAKLRPMGEKNVEAAVPGLGRTLNPYVQDA